MLLEIDRKFSFMTNFGIFDIILTSHLFIKRKDEKRHRSYIFKTREQYEDILQFAFNNYGLNDFINKGKVGIVFSSLGVDYALLVVLERKLDKNPIITIITLDKITTRHYVSHSIFAKEKNKIYMKYELPISYVGAITEYKGVIRDTCKFYHTHYFKSLLEKNKLSKTNTRIVQEMITDWHLNGKLKFGIYWLEYNVGEQLQYLRLSIEKIKRQESTNTAIIFVDLKDSPIGVKQRIKESGEAIIRLGAKNKEFGFNEPQKIPRAKMRITKKSSIHEVEESILKKEKNVA